MPVPPPAESPEAIAARKRLEALDARYAEAMKPVEKLAAAWDFRGAAVRAGEDPLRGRRAHGAVGPAARGTEADARSEAEDHRRDQRRPSRR